MMFWFNVYTKDTLPFGFDNPNDMAFFELQQFPEVELLVSVVIVPCNSPLLVEPR